MMQRIAILLLCGLGYANTASADCDKVASVLGGFAGGVTGYGLIQTLGPASGWIGAGLYGAGIAAASVATSSSVTANCDRLISMIRWYGEVNCQYSTFNYDCGLAMDVTNSLAADFAMCPSCTFDEVMGAFFLVDDARENFFRQVQFNRWGRLASATNVIRRDHIGYVDSSTINSYFLGLQTGFSLLQTTSSASMLR